MSKLKILTVGGAVRDITFETAEGELIRNKEDLTRQQLVGFEFGAKIVVTHAQFSFGGGATNTAISLARLGSNVSTLICLGSDVIAEDILNNLKTHRVKTDFLQKSPTASGLSFVLNYKKLGDEHTLFTYRGANEDLKINLDKIAPAKFDLIYIASFSGTHSKTNLAKIFRYRQPTKFAWNPGTHQIKLGLKTLKPYLKKTNILIVNKDEAIEICLGDPANKNKKLNNPRVLLKILAAYCPGVIAVSDGKHGAYAIFQGEIYYEPPQNVRVKDTTGVGDAFSSTFVWSLEHTGYDIQKSLHLGIKNASAVLKHIGAQNGLLTKSQLL